MIMVFYLLPPSGNIPYQKLEDYALKRLRFLLRLMCCRNPEEVEGTLQDASVVHQSDCLISGSSKDVVSHHMLRLALCDDADTRTFLCSSELALFRLRLAEMSSEEWEDFFKNTENNLKQLMKTASPSSDSFLADLDFLIGILNQEFCSWHFISKEILSHSQYHLCLPFHLALGLVARREVSLSKGLALVPLSQISVVLGELFQRSMEQAVHQAWLQRHVTRCDPRIRRLTAVVKRAYKIETRAFHHLPSYLPRLELSNLWSQAEFFPPCMSTLLSTLKERHRLAHHDRIQLTLFLKDMGLSLHESLLLWKQEYSKPPAPPLDPNKRSWHGNEHRYIYSIRHLYGLEGGRVNYHGHSCSSIQGRSLSYLECGGCPFSLKDESQRTQLVVQDLGQQKRFGMACASYMKTRLKKRQSSIDFARELETALHCGKGESILTRKSMRSPGIHSLESEALDKPDAFCRLQQPETVPSSTYSPVIISNEAFESVRPHLVISDSAGCNIDTGCSITQQYKKNGKHHLRDVSKIRSKLESMESPCHSEQGTLTRDEDNTGKMADDVRKSSHVTDIESLDIDIRKPSDYYRCYVTLLNGMKAVQ